MRKIEVTLDGKQYTVEVRPNPDDRTLYTVTVDGEEIPVYLPPRAGAAAPEWMVVNQRPYEMVVSDSMEWMLSSGGMHTLEVRWMDGAHLRPSVADGRVKAPIPGLINRVLVEPGAAVQVGDPILVLEAMKMENEIRAPRSGTVQSVSVKPGQTVKLGEMLVEVG